MSVFRATAFYLLNRNAFTDDELASNFVTDQPTEAPTSNIGQPREIPTATRNSSGSRVPATHWNSKGLFIMQKPESSLAVGISSICSRSTPCKM